MSRALNAKQVEFKEQLDKFASEKLSPMYRDSKYGSIKDGFRGFENKSFVARGTEHFSTFSILDCFARMLVVVKPVAAVVLRSFDSLNKYDIEISYNRYVDSMPGTTVNLKICELIEVMNATASGASDILGRFTLLSKVMCLQEYKIVQNYAEFLDKFRGKLEDRDKLNPSVITTLKDYADNLASYFNKLRIEDTATEPSSSTALNTLALSTKGYRFFDKISIERPKEYEKLLEQLSFNFLVLDRMIRDKFEDTSVPEDLDMIALYAKILNGFSRAIIDAIKLESSGIQINNVSIIDNSDTLHAELVVINERIKRDEGFNLIGVSKGACVLCSYSLAYAGATGSTRGCSGILYMDWTLPSWVLEGMEMSKHIFQRLESTIDRFSIKACELNLLREYNESNDEFSDDDIYECTTSVPVGGAGGETRSPTRVDGDFEICRLVQLRFDKWCKSLFDLHRTETDVLPVPTTEPTDDTKTLGDSSAADGID